MDHTCKTQPGIDKDTQTATQTDTQTQTHTHIHTETTVNNLTAAAHAFGCTKPLETRYHFIIFRIGTIKRVVFDNVFQHLVVLPNSYES